MKHTANKLVAGLLVAGFGLAAIAQTPPPARAEGNRPPMHDSRDMREAHRGGHDRMDPAERRQRMEQRMARRMGELKQKLAITPAQEGAWTAWTNAMKPPSNRPQRPSFVEIARMTTPERIDRMRAMRAERQRAMDTRMDATKAFYGALDAQQRKTFDEASLRFMGGMGGMGKHGRHHGRA